MIVSPGLAGLDAIMVRDQNGNHVWSYDFVEGRTHEGKKFRMLSLIDELTREALAIRVKRKLNYIDVLETLADVMIVRGTPDYKSGQRSGVHCFDLAQVDR